MNAPYRNDARLAAQDPRAPQPPLRLDDLERLRVPRRRHRHRDLREVRHDLDAADRRPADLRRRAGHRRRRDVALARPARAAEGGEAAGGRGADPPALPEDAPAGRRARLLAEGQVHLHRPRRPRRGVEHVQPPRQRQRRLVRGAERHARPRRPADRAAARRHPPVLPRLAATATAIRSGRSGRTSAAGGTIRAPAERAARALRRPQGRHGGADPAHRRLPRHPDRRGPLAGDRRALPLRLDEGATPRRACRSAARSGTAARRPSSTRAPTAAGATC